jgi:glucose-1-phosphate thymidylyltransferase
MLGVLLSGGFGTRLKPATWVGNKHMLPVYSQEGAVPMLYYPIHTLVKSGITDILVVSSREHSGQIIENLSDGCEFDCEFTYKIQDHEHVHLGIASALQLAESFTADQNFAVILGDNFYADTFAEQVEQFDEKHPLYRPGCQLFLKEVHDPKRFGIATIENNKITEIVEKPKEPKSNWAVTGLYFFTPHVYSIAERLEPSARGELEVSDINDYYVKDQSAEATFLEGFWSDMGTPQSMIRTQEYVNETNFTLRQEGWIERKC